MKKILVIDGNSIVNRAFYGVRPLTTKSGHNTNATFGTVNIIRRQLDLLAPDYAAVAFDRKEPTFRHELFPEYKAGRRPTPDELREQFPDVKEILADMGLSVLELPGFEADDIQGTVASMAHDVDDTESYILTGDRDLLQLIDPKITVLLVTNGDTLTMRAEEFTGKFGISPDRYVEMKAIMGDASDNIPGVKGIGEKGAADLIRNFGTLEEIYDHIDDPRIKPAARNKLIEGKDSAFLSRTLARIDTNAPLGLSLEDLRVKPLRRSELIRKLTELELNSLIARLKADSADADEPQAPSSAMFSVTPTDASPDFLNALTSDRLAAAFDGDDFFLADGNRVYRLSGEVSLIRPLFDGGKIRIVYDGKPLWHRLLSLGVRLPDETILLDLCLYAYVLNPGSGNGGAASLCSMFLGKTPADLPSALALFSDLEVEMRAKIRCNGGERLLDEIELPLLPVLARMEERGMMIDTDGMTEFAEALSALAEELAQSVYREAGTVFNLNSPKQLAEILYDKMQLDVFLGKKSKSKPSTDAQTLEALRPYAPIVADILEYRQVTKLRSTYALALPAAADAGHRVHTDFKQAMTATGRLSSADPNLQNIPIRTAMGRQMRKYFIAGDGRVLADADYSQIELRLMAHLSGDFGMQNAFRNGEDIHRKTAATVFGVPEDEVTDVQRKRAKAVNFGIIYGIGGFSLANDLGISVSEASHYIKSYLNSYPMIASYLEDVVRNATETGYTQTVFGRRRYILELNASNKNLQAFGKRAAMNAPIQGTAADIIKLAMIRVDRRLRRDLPAAHLVMQVHDELIDDCPADLCEQVKMVLKEEMENVVELSVPLTVDITAGQNWLEQE